MLLPDESKLEKMKKVVLMEPLSVNIAHATPSVPNYTSQPKLMSPLHLILILCPNSMATVPILVVVASIVAGEVDLEVFSKFNVRSLSKQVMMLAFIITDPPPKCLHLGMLLNNGMDLPHMDGIGGLTVPINGPLTLINGKHLLHVDLLLDFPHDLYFLHLFLNKDNHICLYYWY